MLYRRGDIKRLFAYCSGAGQRTRRPGAGQHPADVDPSGAGVRGGIWLPGPLVAWFRNVAVLLG
jgi:hypothetical protein